MIPPQQALSERIRFHRQRRDWSQGQLAEAVGVSQDTVSRWETGKNPPTAVDLCELSRVFEVAIDYLVGKVEHEHGLPSGMFIVDLDKIDKPEWDDKWGYQIPQRVQIVGFDEVQKIMAKGQQKLKGGKKR